MEGGGGSGEGVWREEGGREGEEGRSGGSGRRLMGEDASHINTGRGAVVDWACRYTALTEGWIAGGALDVTEPEPLPRDHPLLELTNLVLTPHTGSATLRSRLRMGEMARDNLVAGLEERTLPNQAHE